MTLSYYYKTIIGDIDKLWQGFSWDNKKSKIAAKAGLSCVISVLIAYKLNFSSAYWSAITCSVLAQASVGGVIKKGMMRGLGTILGALLAVIVYGLFIQSYYLFSAFLFLFSVFCYYKKFRAAYYDYFWYLLMATFMIISVSGYESYNPIDIYHTAVYRAIEILIGITVTIFISIYVLPDYASDELKKKFLIFRNKVVELHKDILSAYISKSMPRNETADKFASFKELITNFEELRNTALFEKTISPGKLEQMSSTITGLNVCADNILSFFDNLRKEHNYNFQRHFSGLFKAMLSKLEELVGAIDGSKRKQAVRSGKELDSLLRHAENKYKALTGSGRSRIYPISDVLTFNEALYLFKSIYAVISSTKKEKIVHAATDMLYPGFYGFKEFDFFGKAIELYMPAVRFGIKAGVTILIVIWLWWALELPGGKGGVNIGIAVLTVFQPDSISSNLKAILRISGCIIGAVLGMLFLSIQTDSAIIMTICLFIAVYFSVYVYVGGGPGISYVGLQSALAYIVTTLPGTGPAQDISGIVYRLVGIFLGIFVMWAVNKLFWDEPPLNLLEHHFDSFMRYFSRFKISVYHDDSATRLVKDARLVTSVLNKLRSQEDISEEDYRKLSARLSIYRKLLYTANSMNCVRLSTWNFFSDIFPLFDDILFNLDNAGYDRQKAIEKIHSAVGELKMKIRAYRLMKDMTVEEKQEICHIFFSLDAILKLLT